MQTQQFNERESWKCARYEHNNLMKEYPKSVRETNVIIEWKGILKCARYKRNNPMIENPKSVWYTNVIIERKRI